MNSFFRILRKTDIPICRKSARTWIKSNGQAIKRLRISDFVKDVTQVAGDMPIPPILIGHSMEVLLFRSIWENNSAPSAVLMALCRWEVSFDQRFVWQKSSVGIFKSVLTMDLPFHRFYPACSRIIFLEDMDPKDVTSIFSITNESFPAFLMLILNLPIPENQYAVIGAGRKTTAFFSEGSREDSEKHMIPQDHENMALT